VSSFTGWTVIDIDLVPNCWHQGRIAFRTFQLRLLLNPWQKILLYWASCSEVPALTHSMAIMLQSPQAALDIIGMPNREDAT
jgi:hypothetical protein